MRPEMNGGGAEQQLTLACSLTSCFCKLESRGIDHLLCSTARKNWRYCTLDNSAIKCLPIHTPSYERQKGTVVTSAKSLTWDQAKRDTPGMEKAPQTHFGNSSVKHTLSSSEGLLRNPGSVRRKCVLCPHQLNSSGVGWKTPFHTS